MRGEESCIARGSTITRRAILAAIVGVCGALAAAPADAAVTYEIYDLGAFMPGGTSVAIDINNLGQVTGTATVPNPTPGAPRAVYDAAFRVPYNVKLNRALHDIGGFGDSTYPTKINDLGVVVGLGYIAGGGARAFRTAPNASIDPATDHFDPSPAAAIDPRGINNAGQATGQMDGGPPRAFRSVPGATVNLATDGLFASPPTSFSYGVAINNSGQVAIVGGSVLGQGFTPNRSYRTKPNQMVDPIADDLGTLGGSGNYATATSINDAGYVVGVSENLQGFEQGFIAAPGQKIDPATSGIITLGSNYPYDINNSQAVVGSMSVAGGGSRPFLYQNRTITDLNDLLPVPYDWTLYTAVAINDLGQIVGIGTERQSGRDHAFVLSPVGIPEPTCLLPVLGIFALGRRTRRTRS